MKNTPITPDFPLRPMGDGETLVQVFRTAAERSAARADEDVDLDVDPGGAGGGDGAGRSYAAGPCSPPMRRPGVPSLQRRLYEADGHPVRLGHHDVIRCVGSGGMGVVYEAVDVGPGSAGHRVALKTLRWMTGLGLTRFKNEFRSLCRVSHPNLVALYELGAEEGEWFFTMELVEGQSFLEHVQSGRALGGWEYLGETFDELSQNGGDDGGDNGGDAGDDGGRRAAALEESAVMRRRGFHEGRLRAALRQLAGAVVALHEMGKLHRDLNPGNVLVTREGRVVVLDFGLISDRVRRPGAPYDGASGTPAYMSPEQAADKPATTASDWYGFGVMLFEALTGQLPFCGSTLRMLTNKRHQEAPPPAALAGDLPADLADLCSALLRRAPDRRPDGAAVLQALGAPPRRVRLPAAWDEASFVGRAAELGALAQAAREVAPGRSVTVVVQGPAGIGKSCLGTRFAEQIAAEATVLSAACHERETIPHRLLDGVVDGLAAHLGVLPQAEVRTLLPPGVRDLARIFPVLEGLEALAELGPEPALPSAPPVPAGLGVPDGGAGAAPPGAAATEEAAFGCLREILARLASARPLVLTIDDAHLGDPEGARRLAVLVEGAGLLLVVTHAGEDVQGSPVLPALAARAGDRLRQVVLGPLGPEEACDLARRALPADLAGREEAAAAIAAASEGSPLAACELSARLVEEGSDISLDDAVAARLEGLSEPARRLLTIVAAAPEPVTRGLLSAVAEVGAAGDAALAWLSARRLLCVSGLGSGHRVRIHDERLRAIVAARTPPALARRIHLDLGRALAARPDADPLEAAVCFQRAGAGALAAEHLTVAAERALAAGDPDRAVALWERALADLPADTRATPQARALTLRRAEALVFAGRSTAAAGAYLSGVPGAPHAEALDCRRRAAEHLLLAGHVDEGLEALQPVLAAHGVAWPGTTRRALWTLAARVVALRLRGTGLSERARARIPPSDAARARIQALWSAGKGLSHADPIRSALFAVEALLAAIAAGDMEHAAPALAWVGSVFVYQGSAPEEARGLALIEEAARFARRTGDPYLLGFTWLCSGIARMCAGRFRDALARADEGLGLLDARTGLAWERTVHRAVCLQTLFELGSLAERARRAEDWLRSARARDDRAGEAQALLAVAFGMLASGHPASARRALEEATAHAGQATFGVPHQIALWLQVSILLYEGDAAGARARILAAWPTLRDAQLLRVQLVRVEALLLRGLTAIAAAGTSGRGHEVRLAEIDAAHLERERRPYAQAAATLLRAGIALRRGEISRAVVGLEEAARGYASVEMAVHAAACRRARGSLLGGPEGRALVTAADAVLAAEGVRDGARWAAMYTGVG